MKDEKKAVENRELAGGGFGNSHVLQPDADSASKEHAEAIAEPVVAVTAPEPEKPE